METGRSSLNPNAPSYVPLFKLETEDKIEASKVTHGDSKSSDKIAVTKPSFKNHRETAQNRLPEPGEKAQISEDWTLKGLAISGVHDSPSLYSIDIAEKTNLDEEAEMDLAYLSVMFPDLSEQFLADIYSANGGDLEASADMMNQLEFSADFSNHPDSLDIGGMVEFKSPAEVTTVGQNKKLSGESSGSSSAQ